MNLRIGQVGQAELVSWPSRIDQAKDVTYTC